MKTKHLLLIIIFPFQQIASQILINPYLDYQGQVTPSQDGNNGDPAAQLYSSFRSSVGAYDGEFELFINDLYWFTDFPALAKSYQFEVVSFPFTMPCAFTPMSCGTNATTDRFLYLPSGNLINDTWDTYLRRKTSVGEFDVNGQGKIVLPNCSTKIHQTLVSELFYLDEFIPSYVACKSQTLPHSILKCTINLHCDNTISPNNIISKISFYYDNTRGRMRDYPFITNNLSIAVQEAHDVCFIPKLIVDPGFNLPAIDMIYDDNATNANYTDGIGTVNSYKVGEIDINGCVNVQIPTSQSNTFYNNSIFYHPFPAPEAIIYAPLKNVDGTTLAGYLTIPDKFAFLSLNEGLKQTYFIDRAIDLTEINFQEHVIYNPSEVNIIPNQTTQIITELVFPSYYTFKTINGTLQNKNAAIADNQDPQTGGPYTDLRDVPVRTDLRSENPADPHDVAIPWHSVYASRYYLKEGSKLTIEPCVNIFDATFDVEEGATLLFEIQQYNLGFEHKNLNLIQNLGRYKIKGKGGAILRNYNHTQYVQNGIITQPYNLHYKATSTILSGATVAAIVDDDDQLPGNYSIEPGGDVQFTAPDLISLRDGFSAKTGCTFKAKCEDPGLLPDCPQQLNGNGGSKIAPQFAQQNKTNASSGIIIPNPSNGIFTYRTINFSPENTASIEVINSMGVKIISKMIDDENTNFDSSGILTASLTQYGKGVYYLRAMNGKNVRVEKVVVK